MNGDNKEEFLDLLAKKAIYGLDEAEQRQLDAVDPGTADAEMRSLELTAAAIDLAGLPEIEPMPQHLRARILASSYDHVGLHTLYSEPRPVIEPEPATATSGSSWFGWLGWAAAAAACVALGANVFFTRYSGPSDGAQASVNRTQEDSPRSLSLAEHREQLIATTPDIVRAAWAPGNLKDIKQVTGDVVWSDEKQMGYARLRGLPVNDASATCYQLWIFDQTQDKATPIDGGIFDVSTDGEVIIPIDAKIATNRPHMFALTVERHGGVVVSSREKIVALANIETRPT